MRDRDGSLDELDHDGLVVLLRRLYGSAGEPPLSASTARASTDDELREAIRSLRRRIAVRRDPNAPPLDSVSARRSATPPRSEHIRTFCVLYTADAGLVARARAVLRTRGVPVVAVATPVDLAALAANTTPTHLVIDVSRGADLDLARDLGLRVGDVAVVYCADETAMLAAVGAIPDRGEPT